VSLYIRFDAVGSKTMAQDYMILMKNVWSDNCILKMV